MQIQIQIVQAHSFLWKVGEHVVAGKETLTFGSIFWSLPDFPSLTSPLSQDRENKGNNKITELRTILQRESQSS